MGETTPSENEWMIMEVIWDKTHPITATEVIELLNGVTDISKKTIRVMINRLVSKGILGYTVDKYDQRVYHYFPIKSKEECLDSKSQRFVKNFFKGDTSLAVANFLNTSDITKDQLTELEHLVQTLKEKK